MTFRPIHAEKISVETELKITLTSQACSVTRGYAAFCLSQSGNDLAAAIYEHDCWSSASDAEDALSEFFPQNGTSALLAMPANLAPLQTSSPPIGVAAQDLRRRTTTIVGLAAPSTEQCCRRRRRHHPHHPHLKLQSTRKNSGCTRCSTTTECLSMHRHR